MKKHLTSGLVTALVLTALAFFSAQASTDHEIVRAPAVVSPTTSITPYHDQQLQLCIEPAEAELVDPVMADCCRYRIVGCGKEEGVCVSGSCNSSNLKKARAAFASKHSCKGNKKTGQAGDRCNSNKCTLTP